MRHVLLIIGILALCVPACLSTGRQASSLGGGEGAASGTAANQQAGLAIADSTHEAGEREASPSSDQTGGLNINWQTTTAAGAGSLVLLIWAGITISGDRQETRRMVQLIEALVVIALARDGADMVTLWLERPACRKCRREKARVPERAAA